MNTLEALNFLQEMQKYFANKKDNSEDKAHWANRQNAENCGKIIEFLTEQNRNLGNAKTKPAEPEGMGLTRGEMEQTISSAINCWDTRGTKRLSEHITAFVMAAQAEKGART